MPELPEVESARSVIARSALGREIVDADDTDTYECRPFLPGQIRAALLGSALTEAHRQGKTMWCATSAPDGTTLGLHLGMSGRITVSGPDDEPLAAGGDYWGARLRQLKPIWTRFSLTFADGGRLRLVDPRRLGRVRLDPDLSSLGPDAALATRADFRTRVGHGTAPLKARLLDQHVIAGVGNLLADETLWQARLSPLRPAGSLTDAELDELRRRLRAAVRAAIRHGGVHTGEVIPARHEGAHCPRCGAEMVRATVGGRTTWWCPVEQV